MSKYILQITLKYKQILVALSELNSHGQNMLNIYTDAAKYKNSTKANTYKTFTLYVQMAFSPF